MPRWLSLIKMSVPGCITSSFWRRATILPPRNELLQHLTSRVFLRSLQNIIVVLGFLDEFVCAHHKHHPCVRLRVPNNFSCNALSWRPTPHFPTFESQVQVSIFPNDRSPTRVGNDYHGWPIYTDGGTRIVDGEILCWIGCDFPITTWTNLRSVRPRHYHWSSSCVVWCQNSLHQHRWTDRHVWSIVVSWFSWSCHSWWTVTFFMTLYMLLAVVWARTWPEHTSSWRWHVNNLWSVFSTGYGSPCQHVNGHGGKIG